MKIQIQFKPEEQDSISAELATLGVSHTYRRRFGSNDIEIIFDGDVDEAQVRALVRTGKRNYQLRNKENYDDLGLENYTPAQMNAYIDAQVNTMADVKRVLKILARIVLYLVKHLDDAV